MYCVYSMLMLDSCKEMQESTVVFLLDTGYHDDQSLKELKPEHKKVWEVQQLTAM